MKLILCLLAFLFAAPCLFAQTLDPALQEAVTAVLPSKYVTYAPLIILLIAGLGRAVPALQKGQGLRGWFRALLYGTNTPTAQILIACLCMLSLSSCATTSAIISSPFGRAVVATADQLAKAVVETTERTGLEQIITQATAKVAALDAEGVNADLVQETLRLSRIAGFQSVITAAQAKYQALTGHAFTWSKNPVKVTASKPRLTLPEPNFPPPCDEPDAEASPGCMRLAQRIPDYGYRVAFLLSTANVRN